MPDHSAHAAGWGWREAAILLLAALTVAGYTGLAAAGRGRRWPRLRTLSFTGAVVAVALIASGPVAEAAGHSLPPTWWSTW